MFILIFITIYTYFSDALFESKAKNLHPIVPLLRMHGSYISFCRWIYDTVLN